MIKGLQWWWYVVAAGLLVAEFVSPTAGAREGVLLAAWIWPVLIWSQMGMPRITPCDAVSDFFGRASRLSTVSRVMDCRSHRCTYDRCRRGDSIVIQFELANACVVAGRRIIHSEPGAGIGSVERFQQALRGSLHGVVVCGAIALHSWARLRWWNARLEFARTVSESGCRIIARGMSWETPAGCVCVTARDKKRHGLHRAPGERNHFVVRC